jgi:hypothetical protein
MRRLRRRVSRAAVKIGGGRAAFLNDLIEPPVEPRQRFCDTVGAARFGGWAWSGAWLRIHMRRSHRRRIRMSHAFELPSQRVETIVDGGEVLADGVLVVVRFSI